MRNNIKKFLMTLGLMAIVASCDTDYIEDPDNPVSVPSIQLFNNATYDLAWELNDEWVAGRGTLGIAQYWAGAFYVEENLYALRPSMIDDMWEWPYRILTDYQKVIELNEDPETKALMEPYGSNNDQIQVCRMMMAYTFYKLVDTFGDVPYWSYGQRDNPDFQALSLLDENPVPNPAYTNASIIYQDLLAELLDASKKINPSGSTFGTIYSANSDWIKFAHSLRLRLAVHLLDVNPTLANNVFMESNEPAFGSNTDNALFTFGTDDITGGPWHNAFTVNARRDFAPTLSFVDLLYNRTGPFMNSDADPRVELYFDKRLESEEVVGIPYGFGQDIARAVVDEGIPAEHILAPDFSQPLLTYSEVEFIRSEFTDWNQMHYENGIKASMEYWRAPSDVIDNYVESIAVASEETVLTQKYIALYMDGLEAWTEYRRTGYPNTLSVPGDTYDGTTFVTNIPGLDIIPTRVIYPQNEQLLNRSNWDSARSKLNNGDTMFSKIFWDVD
ncbi:SusD/RagB family nutrient-binding outer membrane lipoprotein [Muricauda sp. HICW]|uniref:SusD/RagB family nutrient-binding outer membrane lipoprotein n=1 Tax=Flagellimonas chongwuensis TaxID=2697365 RepID=A0A850NGF7_9FLAO|nr:SusD/RagB family nutrient-binding outer membrane lipoprotein [Allomuricauda chongwuensis]NVN17498.1 SusD/RagB family nutrient-binding outer membrane lipoprotein [Allomuricauda chongwuensis]